MGNIALSYSRLSTYETCPRKFQASYITKVMPDDSDNPSFVKGNKIHSDLENVVNNRLLEKPQEANLSDYVKNTMPILESIFKNYDNIYPEQQVSVDSAFNKVDWFSKSSYYRAIFDLTATAGNKGLIIDYKSGKIRDYDDSDTGQLKLSATVLMSIRAELTEVDTAYLFVEHKHTIKRKFKREDLPAMQQAFIDASNTVSNDTEFLPKKNKYCFFCPIPAELCEHKK